MTQRWLVTGQRAHSEGRAVTVHLVGAGPGDPKLLTRRGARRARAARSAVVYDRPSLDEIVALAPAEAERHCVGLARRPARRCPRHEVNELLVELGRAHDEVVRLKSGDPFVASRGGEEARGARRRRRRRRGSCPGCPPRSRRRPPPGSR